MKRITINTIRQQLGDARKNYTNEVTKCRKTKIYQVLHFQKPGFLGFHLLKKIVAFHLPVNT